MQDFPSSLVLWCVCSAAWISCWLTLVLSSGSGSLPAVCSSSVCCCSGARALLGIFSEQVTATLQSRPQPGLALGLTGKGLALRTLLAMPAPVPN